MTEGINETISLKLRGGSTAQTATISSESREAILRCRIGYDQAQAILRSAAFIKVFAWIIGALIAIAAIAACAAIGVHLTDMEGFGGLALFLTGIVVGVVGHILSILVKAVGQLLIAQVDTVANGSPFLNDVQRAEVMSLL